MAVALAGFALVSVAAHAADARDDVFKAYQKLMASRFAVDINTTGESGTMKSHGEYDTVDRIHFKNDKMEMIVVPSVRSFGRRRWIAPSRIASFNAATERMFSSPPRSSIASRR